MMLDKLKNLGAREKFLIGVIVATIVVPAIGSLVVIPAVMRYRVLDAKIMSAKEQIRENKNYLEKKQITQKQYDAIRDLLAKATLPTEDIDSLKGDVEELASRTKFTYGTMSHRDPESMNEFCDEYIIDISKFKTDIQNMLVFARELQSAPGMMRVAALNVKPVKGEPMVTGSISISKVMIADTENKKHTEAVKE